MKGDRVSNSSTPDTGNWMVKPDYLSETPPPPLPHPLYAKVNTVMHCYTVFVSLSAVRGSAITLHTPPRSIYCLATINGWNVL